MRAVSLLNCLLFFFITSVCHFSSVETAIASEYQKPSWVNTTAKAAVIRNSKVKNINSPDYYIVKFTITYTNNSRDKIITKIFNKKTLVEYIMPTASGVKKKLYYKGTSTRVNTVELYPGQSTSLVYYTTPFNFMKHLAGGTVASQIKRYNEFLNSKKMKFTFKYWHGFQVRSVKL